MKDLIDLILFLQILTNAPAIHAVIMLRATIISVDILAHAIMDTRKMTKIYVKV